MLSKPPRLAWVPLVLALVPATARASEKNSDAETARSAVAVLRARCVRCHGPARQKGGLRLDLRSSPLRGGGLGGPDIIPGDAENSPLFARVASDDSFDRMPPIGGPLPPGEIALIRLWIDSGAPWPEPSGPLSNDSAPKEPAISEPGHDHWAFRPLARVEPPEVSLADWPRNPVDQFILAKLEPLGLRPNGEAPRRVLIRRLSFDLTGLPPAPEEVARFLDDTGPDAYGRLVDRLLESPQFGERWATHWLDLARYADSSGFENDTDRPGAFFYRDFVIWAFNHDLPFDQFLSWQIAGDELAPKDPRAWAATGFLTAGPHIGLKTGTPAERELHQYDEWDDQLSTTGSAFLGLTVGCARCHDHKFDPIPSRDYYRLLAAFTSSERSERLLPGYENPALGLKDRGPVPETSYLLSRGDPARKAEEISLGFLSVLSEGQTDFEPLPDSTGQRSALARWLTDTDHGAGALAARVIVNRLWQHHFGVGLVGTPNDFGLQGEPPSHPALLDYLAGELVANGWHLKPVHRLIVTSATYRQHCGADAARARLDPDGRLLSRRRPVRLEAEALRDALLSVSGELDPARGGPSVKPFVPPEALAGRNKDDKVPRPKADGPSQWRRSVYLFVKRTIPTPLLRAFDAPPASESTGRRAVSTVAPQALALLNGQFVRSRATAFALRVVREAGPEPEPQVRRAFLLALGRPPSETESQRTADFLRQGGPDALANLCQVLFSLNEFLYVE